jgi:L-glyceraldehyde 3-phosphate reductase
MRKFASDRYQDMAYRRCGRSGLMLPAISIGFWQALGEPGNDDLCREVAYYCFDHGITHFDLANNYGSPAGNSEIVVGKVLKDMPRDEMIISTKAGNFMWEGPYGEWGSRKHLIASLDQSLQRLGLDYVDIYYSHRPDFDTPLEETMGALEQVIRQGKALYAGVSNYPGLFYRQAVEINKRHGWPPITIHQPCYNMIDRWVERDLLKHTAECGTGVIAFCPLAEGILTGKYLNGLPADSRWGRRGDEGRKWYEDKKQKGIWDKVAGLNEIAKERGQTLAQMALAWLLKDERVTSVLTGASRVDQIENSLAAANSAPFSAEELERIEGILTP